MTKSVKRLYSDFKPQKYILDISIDPDKMTFSGTAIIAGKKTGRPSQRLTFHQNHLTIVEAHITKHDKKGDNDVIVDRINHHSSYNEVRLHAKEMIYPGAYTVRLKFKGKITRQMNGVYPCFFEQDGQQKKLIATQFESHHAREVFPCIDEPEAKAVFELSITHPANHVVLSNTPVKSSEPGDDAKAKDRVLTKFEPTPHMSTYLLAFVTGELGFKEAKTKDNVLVRAYATPDNVDFTDFGLEVAVKCLEFYNDYFGIDYPLDKCDLIALPDFSSGAMENWGCITFREQCLLVDPKNTTLATKQYVAMVVAHELAHQWFGNLVTMRWWTDLWLNEGFASWIEYLAIDHLFPEWDMWSQFAVDEQQQALKLDALEHTHPIEVAIHHPDEIRTIFDAISYSKGASVIHMLHEYLGKRDFQAGLRHYLKKHSYANTDTIDLWSSLEEVSKKPVKKFMHAWTSQPGYPLVEATVESDSVKLQQRRFYTNPLHAKTTKTLWPIPLLAGTTLPDTLEVSYIEVPEKDTNKLKLNQGQSGFYRTTYNASHIERLGELIRRGKLSPLDRLGILTDLFETAKAGHTDTAEALHFLTNFSNEDSYPAWDTIASSLGSLRLAMDDEELRDSMKPYIIKLVATQLKRLGWDRKKSDSHFDRLLRPIIIGLAASADEPAITLKCQSLFKQAKVGDINIDPDLRGIVFNTSARLGGKAEFDKLLRLHDSTSLSEERTTLASAITGFKQPELIQQALALITTDTVRLQDAAYWIAYSFMNRFAKHDAWEWLTQNWKWIHTNMGSDLSFYRMPVYAARSFSDPDFIPKYEKFFMSHMVPALDRSYNQGLEMIQWQSEWKKRALKETKAFFKSQ